LDPVVNPILTEQQIDVLRGAGTARDTKTGEVLFRAGDITYDFFVVLAGKVAVADEDGATERVLGVAGTGEVLGELGLLTGERAYLSAVVREPGAVLAVPAAALRKLVGKSPLGEFLVEVLIRRRLTLVRMQIGLQIFGSGFSRDTQRLRQFAA